MSLPLALKYRPSTFSEVIGQEQVTNSLMAALDAHQIHHAYLFSGPRGCGKTSSARILARSLNCEKGPTANPCGECQSCKDLIANGPGSLDVIEMDAATHGLVDDARELRDKALFAPVQNRYKIYIIDEAHQLGPAAANALLKIVEEPPPYVIFIFATTEPEKVIPTIRSRTHHYQFRLVNPEVLANHLVLVATREGIALDDGVVELAVRAGNGSVRDALSSFGQLLNGAHQGRVTYESAITLLSQTSNEILSRTIEAILRREAGELIEIVHRLFETGSDIRRFSLDLLDRLRDLMVLNATAGDSKRLLRIYSGDELLNLHQLASSQSIAQLISLSEVVSDHLVRLRTAISPQITIETMLLRMINLSSSNLNEIATPKKPISGVKRPNTEPRLTEKVLESRVNRTKTDSTTAITGKKIPLTDLRILENNWPRVLEVIKNQRRLTWTLLSSQSHPTSLESGVIQISLPSSGALDSFERSNSSEILKSAFAQIFEGEFSVEMIVKGARGPMTNKPQESEIADSSDQLTGEELLIKELGARVIERQEQ